MTDEEVIASAKEAAGTMPAQQRFTTGSPLGIRVPVPPMSEGTRQLIGKTILPTAASIAATAATGGASLPVQMLGQGLAGGGAEYLNQKLGMTPESNTAIAASAAVPMAAQAVVPVVRAGLNLLPTAKNVANLNVMANRTAQGAADALPMPLPSGPLFTQAAQSGVKIPMTNTITTIETELPRLLKATPELQKQNGQAIKIAKDLLNEIKISANSGTMTPDKLQANLETLGQVANKMRADKTPGSGVLKQIISGAKKDLDVAADLAETNLVSGKTVDAGAHLLRQGRQSYMQEQVNSEIKQAVTDAAKVLRGQGANIQFDSQVVLKELRDNPYFKKVYDEQAQGEIIKIFQMLNSVPALKPGVGQSVGSSRIMKSVIGGGITGPAGLAAGGPAGAAVGTAIGASIPLAVDTVNNLALALRMPAGRQFLASLLKNSDGALTPGVAVALSAFVRAAMTPKPTTSYQGSPPLE